MAKNDGLRQELSAAMNELRTLRDEIRLQLHLAGMEAQERWDRDLEPRLFSMEKRVEREVGATTRSALRDLAESMKKFRASLTN